MSIRRKELHSQRNEPSELELLATFPRPPRPTLQSMGLTPWPSSYGVMGTRIVNKDAETDSLYAEPRRPLLPQAQLARDPPSDPLPFVKHEADFQLVLDHPFKVYAPGEIITGYILGWSSVEEHVHIFFLGQATTTLQDPKYTHTNRTPLVFQVKYLTATSHGSLPRFEVSIPHTSDIPFRDLSDSKRMHELVKNHWTISWPEQDSFESDAGHPLPPSLYLGPCSASRLSSVHSFAWVSYALIAVRSKSDCSTNRLVPDASFHLPVALTTLRLPVSKINRLKNEKHHMNSSVSIQTAALVKGRKLGLREHICDVFNTSAPEFYFSVKVIVPRCSAPGADLKISVTLEVLRPPLGRLYNFAIPDITLVSICFSVWSYTGIRTLVPATAPSPPVLNASKAPSRRETFKNVDFRQTQTPTNATFTPQQGDFVGQVCVATVTLPKGLLPSFKTYNAWRAYRLECAIRLRVAGKEEEARCANDVDIVAGGDAQVERTRVPTGDDTDKRVAEAMVRAYVLE